MALGKPTFLHDASGPDGLIECDRLARVLSVSMSELTAAIGPPLSDTFATASWSSAGRRRKPSNGFGRSPSLDSAAKPPGSLCAEDGPKTCSTIWTALPQAVSLDLPRSFYGLVPRHHF